MDCLTCGDRHISTDHRRKRLGRPRSGWRCLSCSAFTMSISAFSSRTTTLPPEVSRGGYPPSVIEYLEFSIFARVLSFKYPLPKTSPAPAFFVACREAPMNVSGTHLTYPSGCPFLRTLSIISFASTQLHLQAKIPITSGKRTKNAKTRLDCG